MDRNEVRARRVIAVSVTYWIVTLAAAIAGIFSRDDAEVTAGDLISLLFVPVTLAAWLQTWAWLRPVVAAARPLDPQTFQYRAGWALWGWVTPIAAFWIPRRLLDRSHQLLSRTSGHVGTLATSVWWGLFVAVNVLDWLSMRLAATELPGWWVVDLVSAGLLTIALPLWLTVVRELTACHASYLLQARA